MDLIKKQKKQIVKLLEDRHRLGQLEEQVKRFAPERERYAAEVGTLTGKIKTLEVQLAASKKEADEVHILKFEIIELRASLDEMNNTMRNQVQLLRSQDIERDRLVKERDELRSKIDSKELEKTRRRLQERGDELSSERQKILNLERQLQAALSRIRYHEKNEKLDVRGSIVPQQQGATK